MGRNTERLDLRLSDEHKSRLRRAAGLRGLPVATFVREAALREADLTVAKEAGGPPEGGLATKLRGRASARLSTEQIMQLTRVP